MTTYKIKPEFDGETGQVTGMSVTDSDGYTWDGFESLHDAREFVAHREAEERDDHARDVFAADLDALADEMRGWSREQIRAMKDAMIEGLRIARKIGEKSEAGC